MLKSTKKILDELYEISPSLKGDESKLQRLIVFLEQHNPKVKPSKKFRDNLHNKLTTIGEFKQIQPKTKFNFMTIVRPMFLMIFGLFALSQFHNFLSLDEIDVRELPSQNRQEFVIESEETGTEEIDEDSLEERSEEGTLTDQDEDTDDTSEVSDDQAESLNDKDDTDSNLEINESKNENSVPDTNEQESKSQQETSGASTSVSNESSTTVGESRLTGTEDKTQGSSDQAEEISSQENSSSSSDSSTDNSQDASTNNGDNSDTSSEDLAPGESADFNSEVEGTTEEGSSEAPATGQQGASSQAGAEEVPITQDSTNTDPEGGTSSENSSSDASVDNSDIEEEDSDEPTISPSSSQESDDPEIQSTSSQNTVSGSYYTCIDGEIQVQDTRDQRNIIKTYCEEKGGKLQNDPNINYYLCQVNPKKEVGIDYIGRDLCQ